MAKHRLGRLPRRHLPQEELVLIDEMSLLTGPAFLAAMARSALKGGAKKQGAARGSR
jgi:hypothetical protein